MADFGSLVPDVPPQQSESESLAAHLLRQALNFGDGIEQRERRMRGEPLQQRQPARQAAPYRDVSFLPPSENIDDRRNQGLSLAAALTGMTPEMWSQAIRHPLTPLNPEISRTVPSTTTDPLASALGYNDIGMLSLRRLGSSSVGR